MLVNEVHYTDLYPESFLAFRKKYLPLLRKHKLYNVYVQFSNFANSTIDRNPYQSPTHTDMVGVYAYPIAYVLQYPADIWYGQGARYMRVLEDTSRNKINLRYIDSEDKAERLINSMGFSTRETMTLIDMARTTYKHKKGVTKWGKIALAATQMDLLGPVLAPAKSSIVGYSPPEYRTRTGLEQSKLFIKAGYDAVEDTGSNNKMAVLNDREPEQIVFLTRHAFKVIEVVNLRIGIPTKDLPSFVTADPSNERLERSLAALIARAMDDKLSESLRYGTHMYWTKNGRRIEIDFERPRSYYDNRKMGEKKHKEYKLHDSYRTKIKIRSEHGIFDNTYFSDETFQEITNDVAKWWHHDWMTRTRDSAHGWNPETRASYEADLKASEHRATTQRLEDERQKRIKELPVFIADTQWVATRYNLIFEPAADFDSNEHLLKALDYLTNFWRNHSKEEDYIKDGFEWVRTNVFGPLIAESIIPVWNQLEEILVTAWEKDIKSSDKNWLFLKGGSQIFHNIRYYILMSEDLS